MLKEELRNICYLQKLYDRHSREEKLDEACGHMAGNKNCREFWWEDLKLGNLFKDMISYEKELDIDNKLHNYLKITGILNNVFKPQKTLKKTRLKLYNTLAFPVLLYGSESWTIKARDARRITAAGMKYMRRTAGYTWTDHETNTQIAKELKLTPILDKLQEYEGWNFTSGNYLFTTDTK